MSSLCVLLPPFICITHALHTLRNVPLTRAQHSACTFHWQVTQAICWRRGCWCQFLGISLQATLSPSATRNTPPCAMLSEGALGYSRAGSAACSATKPFSTSLIEQQVSFLPALLCTTLPWRLESRCLPRTAMVGPCRLLLFEAVPVCWRMASCGETQARSPEKGAMNGGCEPFLTCRGLVSSLAHTQHFFSLPNKRAMFSVQRWAAVHFHKWGFYCALLTVKWFATGATFLCNMCIVKRFFILSHVSSSMLISGNMALTATPTHTVSSL